ncbi:cell division protein FtsI [Nitratiruptor sp. YY08-14]|uniref:peptidoglycan D,D-transpeptidase FtsI family protein n=1 Tax=Nitratiruptor sp. YY08-14 TaxID=2724899 RepID=UPI0019163DFA|nr:penicillin-binding protein 2 [Nitratiruptor sp. YY08-14]BCD64764.1 cell division protein FtsI [Nitratiruptor sp. YY08-14]
MDQTTKLYKIVSIFLLFVFGIAIFLAVLFKIVVEDRRLPRLIVEEKNRAIRGSIVSSDGYQVAYSNKLYKVAVNTRCIDPNKKELFVKLFSIFSGMNPKIIRKKLRKKGYVVLSYNIDTKTAYQLKSLARKLYRMDMFVPYKVGNRVIKQGLTILESGESRAFPYKDTLTPVLGYVRKYEDHQYTKIAGVKGIEKYYEAKIRPRQDGIIRGKRDIGNNIIFNKETFVKKRIDGYNVHLNINMLFQKNLEKILDTHKKDLEAKEIIAAVMESDSGKILAIASSNRFYPKHIRKKDYNALNAKVIEYEFEPGSVMKPITFALLLQNRHISLYDIVFGYNGRYKLGRKIITDEHKMGWMGVEDVIVYSSNIGIAQLAQKLSQTEFYNGLKKFGFSQKTGIDLPYEHSGYLIPVYKFRSEIYKATVGYGYGIKTTFMQLLNAYNVFNNDGVRITPRIASFLTTPSGKRVALKPPKRVRVIDEKTAAMVRNVLRKVVEKGTGTVAKVEGLFIGGKTGTAHRVKHGRYVHLYNSSFFGFADDRTHRYTIGVTVIEPHTRHFASQTAVPVFRDIVLEMVNEGYLIPKQ